jgi:hypothetical protein
MGKTTREGVELRQDADVKRAKDKAGVLESVTDSVRLLKRVVGVLLGSLAVGTQVSNVLVCLFVIFMGPAFIIELLP